MILHFEVPKDSTKKLLDLINPWQHGRVQKQQKSVAFLYTNNAQAENEFRKIVPFTIASKKYLE
jgi:hypothetical protein